MAMQVYIGQRVRINEKYATVIKNDGDRAGGGNAVGTEFVVTGVKHGGVPHGHESDLIISGDPNGWGMWGDFVDVVPSKAHTTTTIKARLNYHDIEKIVDVTSGSAAISLSVRPNPSKYGDTTGTTNLTPEAAEELAYDLLARVADIRMNTKGA